MNKDIRAIWTPTHSKNDVFLTSLQDRLGVSLSIIGSQLTTAIQENNNETEIIVSKEWNQKLADAASLITDVHYGICQKRRFKLRGLINEETWAAAQNCNIDEFLFGKNFLTSVTARQTMKKSAATLKRPTKPTTSTSCRPASTGRNYLNYQRQKFRGRQIERDRLMTQEGRLLSQRSPQQQRNRHYNRRSQPHQRRYRDNQQI